MYSQPQLLPLSRTFKGNEAEIWNNFARVWQKSISSPRESHNDEELDIYEL